MDRAGENAPGFPRHLAGREREWIHWILPDDRAGYRDYLLHIQSMLVIGQGRRGKGEIILGGQGSGPDFGAPLAPVFAYGAVETDVGTISTTLREILDGQISGVIVSH